MKTIFALSTLAAVATAQIGTFDQDGYMDLPSIPGMDFVGFGYDVRYLDDTNQGLRLPLMQFTFSEKKTYRYPLYKDRMYRVPDELFVRTVGTATAENTQFSTIEEYRENWAAKLGFKYSRSSTEPVPPENVNTTNQAGNEANAFNSSATPDLNNTNSRTEGYGDLLPSKYKSTSSGLFEVGVDFQFRKNMLKDSNPLQLSVHNTQTHQLYQLMVNKNKIRTHMQADINVLQEKQFATEPDAFRAFFEKYGTHYVQTAMLGGAIELASITSSIAETDFITTTANLSIVFATNESSSDVTGNVTEKLLPKDPRCTGDEDGWSWNTLKEECQTPYELECYAQMQPENEYVEKFDYVMDDEQHHNFIPMNFTDEGRGDAYTAFPWRRGPLPGLTRNCLTQDTVATCTFEAPSHFFFTPAGVTTAGRQNVLVMNSETQTADSNSRGISRQVKWGQPQLIQWDMFVVDGVNNVNPSHSYANIRFAYEGDVYTEQDDCGMWHLQIRGGSQPNVSHAVIAHTLADVQDVNHYTANKNHPILRGEWITYKLLINWETYKTDLWIKRQIPSAKWVLTNLRDVPLMFDKTGIDRIDLWNFKANSGRTLFDSMYFCNNAGGAKYQPVSKNAAVQKANSNMKQLITGDLDFAFEKRATSRKIQETSNYKVKGGDTSIVDLLNLRAKGETFRDWKASIPRNPAPVSFTLREISALFPKDPIQVTAGLASSGNKRQEVPLESVTIVPREEMRKAIAAFLVTVEEGEIIYPTAADEPQGFAVPLGQS
jgi:hypothetical protein